MDSIKQVDFNFDVSDVDVELNNLTYNVNNLSNDDIIILEDTL